MQTRKFLAVAITAFAAAILVFLTGCTGLGPHAVTAPRHSAPVPRQELFGFDTYDTPDFLGVTRLVRLDPVTLREQLFSSLRLGDSITGHVFSPDRRFLAFGGQTFGEIIVADLVRYDIVWRPKIVANPQPIGAPVVVSVASWPRADRLLAYSEPTEAHATYPARLVVVDPVNHLTVRAEPLGGSVNAADVLPDGRTVFLIAPVGRIAPARLVVADPDGGLRSTLLRDIPAGFGTGPSWDNEDEEPGFVIVGQHVYVVGTSDRVADLDASTGRLTYHRVPGLLSRSIKDGPSVDPGSGGIMWDDGRTIGSAGDGLLYAYGGATRPARHGTQNQEFTSFAQIVDTRTWTVRRTLGNVTQVVAANGLYYCWVGDGKYADNISYLVALHPDGSVAFRRTTPDASWAISAGRLFESSNGTGDQELDVELDPFTGKVLRRVTLPLWFPLDLIPWTYPSPSSTG